MPRKLTTMLSYSAPIRRRLFRSAPSRVAVAALAISSLFPVACGNTSAGAHNDQPSAAALLDQPWERVVEAARGQSVTWGMWMGDPFINDYVEQWVAPRLAEQYGIELDVVSAQGNEIVNLLLTEMEAGKAESELDLLWINGETFYQLRQIDALFGPFAKSLPSGALIDFDDPFIGLDFQQPVDGYEAPWGNVQLALIYDSARVDDPPKDRDELARWVRAHPGRFTFDTAFTGMTFLKSLLIDFAGGQGSFDGPFDEEVYARSSALLFAYLRELQPYLWREGKTFPAQVSELHQLFANQEIDFTMSNNDGEVDNKVLQGQLPESSRAYVLDSGTIRNTHYLGIPRGSGQIAAALVTIAFLQSPEAQWKKSKPAVWGDGTVLDLDRLPPEWQERFRSVPQRERSPQREAIGDRALAEPAPEVMIRLHADFRRELLGG